MSEQKNEQEVAQLADDMRFLNCNPDARGMVHPDTLVEPGSPKTAVKRNSDSKEDQLEAAGGVGGVTSPQRSLMKRKRSREASPEAGASSPDDVSMPETKPDN